MLGLLLALLGLAMATAIAAWTLEPVNRAARNRRAPVQFMLVDFLCLVVLLQLALALVHAFFSTRDIPTAGWFFAYGAAWFAFGLMWWLSVQTLSRAGIRHAWRRAVFLAFVVPLTVYASIAVPVTSLTLLFGFRTPATPDGMPGRLVAMLVTIDVVSIFVLCGCGCLTRWIAAAASPSTAEPEPRETGGPNSLADTTSPPP